MNDKTDANALAATMAASINAFVTESPKFAGAPAGYVPLGGNTAPKNINPSDIPQTIDELGELESYTYDLTVTAAGKLDIPVVGSVSGGVERRVVVFEWSQFKKVFDANIEYRYGFVIRFCLIFSKWNVNTKLTLPFLAAESELGNIRAAWLMQVRGLAGTPISSVIIPPQDLKVETFVIAKQSLDAAIKAVRDPNTRFVPGIVLSRIDPTTPETAFWQAAVKAFAVSCVKRGRTRESAQSRLGSTDTASADIIAEVYDSFGINLPNVSPDNSAKTSATRILQGIEADV